MAGWSQSHFLQALGWATLNSLWQMALLWCLFLGASQLFKLSATRKYQAAVGAVIIGFGWFISTFIIYYQNNSSTYALFENTIVHSNSILHICLLSASVTYLVLLVFPAVRLFRNWQFVQRIKKEGHQKADWKYRLFVQKIAAHLGITQKVKLAVSNLVASPVTVGYLKPVILLPVAALNNLTTTQVEAILLHELTHIRRYDYLINLIVTLIHTLLYFNPFVKAFMNTIEAEREACCDELVLQFGYDKLGYASALLHLEKAVQQQHHSLALAAAGKQSLLTRIEKIVGMEKKKTFKLIQMAPLFLAMFCVLLFNSVLIIKDAHKGEPIAYTNDTVFMPWHIDDNKAANTAASPARKQVAAAEEQRQNSAVPGDETVALVHSFTPSVPATEVPAPATSHIIPVNFDIIDGSLTNEEKENVTSTIEATKKAAKTLQWKEIEASMGEVMSKKEKALARQEYLQEIEKVAWDNIEQNLKANYDKINWHIISENVNRVIAEVQLDSLQTVYSLALSELEKGERNLKAKASCATPLPDVSVADMQQAKEEVRKNLDSLKRIKPKKVVRL